MAGMPRPGLPVVGGLTHDAKSIRLKPGETVTAGMMSAED